MGRVDADDIYVDFHEGRISSSDEYYPASEYEALVAERDRLKAELEYQKTIEEQMDVINEGLRASHAALVEAASELHHWHDWGKNDEGVVVSSEVVRKIWAALAEVKG